jgi:hypothetical protein
MSPGNTHHSRPTWPDWILILLLALPGPAVLAAPATVAVFSSSNVGAYQQSRTAFEQAVIEHLPDTRFVEYLANGKEDRPDALLQQLRKAPPAMIYSLGSKATRNRSVPPPIIPSPLGRGLG